MGGTFIFPIKDSIFYSASIPTHYMAWKAINSFLFIQYSDVTDYKGAIIFPFLMPIVWDKLINGLHYYPMRELYSLGNNNFAKLEGA